MPNYYSQCGEDAWVEQNCAPVQSFCEVGAHDGESSSNTLRFETLGATGLLIEPVPSLAALCRARRKVPTICCAVGRPRLDWMPVKEGGLSGFGRPGERHPVCVVALDDLLARFGVKPDLLSIDTEGSELEVWRTVCDYHRPRVVVMEYQTCQEPPNDGAIIAVMEPQGYTLRHRTAFNLIFTDGR